MKLLQRTTFQKTIHQRTELKKYSFVPPLQPDTTIAKTRGLFGPARQATRKKIGHFGKKISAK